MTLFKKLGVKKALRKRARKFRAGQRLQVRVTAPGHIGKVVKYKLEEGQAADRQGPLPAAREHEPAAPLRLARLREVLHARLPGRAGCG